MVDRVRRAFEHTLIQKPGQRLLRGIALPFVRAHSAGQGGKSVNASLNLTSFIDFLIVVVVFLLMSFSASAQTPPGKEFNLAAGENVVDNVEAPVVAISGSQILLDGIPAGTTREIEAAGRLIRIDELHRLLRAKHELWKQLNPGRTFPGVLLIQVDKNAPALVVKSVSQTAAQAGYPNLSFLVRRLSPSRR